MKNILTKKKDIIIILRPNEVRTLEEKALEGTLYTPHDISKQGVLYLLHDNMQQNVNGNGVGVEQKIGKWSVFMGDNSYLQLRQDGRIERIHSAMGTARICIYNETKLTPLEHALFDEFLDYARHH